MGSFAYKIVTKSESRQVEFGFSKESWHVFSASDPANAKTLALNQIRQIVLQKSPAESDLVNDSWIESCERIPEYDYIAKKHPNNLIAKSDNGIFWSLK